MAKMMSWIENSSLLVLSSERHRSISCIKYLDIKNQPHIPKIYLTNWPKSMWYCWKKASSGVREKNIVKYWKKKIRDIINLPCTGSEEKAEYRRKMFKVSRRAQLHTSIHEWIIFRISKMFFFSNYRLLFVIYERW